MRRFDPCHGESGAQRLLEVAERLFAARGFAGASVGEITRVANVSRPVLYYHFGSKEGLYLAVARSVAAAYEAALGRAAAGAENLVAKIRRVCWAHAVGGRELARLDAAGASAPSLEGDVASVSGPCPRLAQAVAAVRALVAEGVEAGELDGCDPTAAARALVGAAEASVAMLACAQAEPPSLEQVNEALDIVLRGLVRDEDQAGTDRPETR